MGVTTAVMGLAVLGLWALVAPAGSLHAADDGIVRLAVAGRPSQEPGLAVLGQTVAVAWAAGSGSAADLYVAVSQDGGRTFGRPVRANDRPGTVRGGAEQAPRIALSAAPGAAGPPSVTVVWNGREPASVVRMARSTDGGLTFAPSHSLAGPKAQGNRGWASLAVDARGAAHAIWLDHRGSAGDGTAGHHAHATDAAPAHHQAGAAPRTGGDASAESVAKAQKSGLYYASVLPGGAGPARSVAAGVCYCCKTALATRTVGGRALLVAAWRHVYPGNFRDMATAQSVDGGVTFSAPARVSEDGWQLDGCPEDGPSVSIDGGGTMHLLWPTVVQAGEPYKALFYASRRDSAWTPRLQVTGAGLNVAHPSLAVADDGSALAVWDQLGKGPRTIQMSVRTVGGRGFAAPRQVSGTATARYPVVAWRDARTALVAWREGEGAGTRIAVEVVSSPN